MTEPLDHTTLSVLMQIAQNTGRIADEIHARGKMEAIEKKLDEVLARMVVLRNDHGVLAEALERIEQAVNRKRVRPRGPHFVNKRPE